MAKRNAAVALNDKLIGVPHEIKGPTPHCRKTRSELENLAKVCVQTFEQLRDQAMFVREPVMKTKLAEQLLGAKYRAFYNSFKASENTLVAINKDIAQLDLIKDPANYNMECIGLGSRYNEWLEYFKTVPMMLMAEMHDIVHDKSAELDAAYKQEQENVKH